MVTDVHIGRKLTVPTIPIPKAPSESDKRPYSPDLCCVLELVLTISARNRIVFR